MIRLNFTVFFFVLGAYVQNLAHAQDTSSINIKPLKSWEIGYDLLQLKELFNPISSESMTYGFLLRKNYNNKAIRFKGSFFSKIDPDIIGLKTFERKRFRMEMMLGYEWQKFVLPKFNIFYGGDIGYSWYRGKEAVVDTSNGFTSYQVLHTYSQHALADAFIGARFFITKNLSISMETALNIDWIRAKGISEGYTIQQDGTEILTNAGRDTGFTPFNKVYQFSPLSKLYVSYHF